MQQMSVGGFASKANVARQIMPRKSLDRIANDLRKGKVIEVRRRPRYWLAAETQKKQN
jgi:hypothetical protein